jgi:hypothetical protein
MRSSFDIPRVTAVHYLHDHVLWIAFDNGLAGAIDLSDRLVGPVLEPLRDAALFARVRLGAETIEWSNGTDWSPETLHELVLAATGFPVRGNDDDPFADAVHPAGVPEISRFFGIVITMFYDDHARPHFHARLGGEAIAIEIDADGIRGSFPPSRLLLLFEWRDRHRDELRANWLRMRNGESPLPIEPLD